MENLFVHDDNIYKYKDVIEISKIYVKMETYKPPRKFNWRKFRFGGDFTKRRVGSIRYHILMGSPIASRLIFTQEFDYTVVIDSADDTMVETPIDFLADYNKRIMEWDKSLNKKK